ncbi:MAG: hypothetical protein HGA47_06670 [Zoogloea sp.]|nr:hypothetical protein [Zoogloea sp.]
MKKLLQKSRSSVSCSRRKPAYRSSAQRAADETATAPLGKKISLNKKRKLAAWDDDYRGAMPGIRRPHD